MGNSPLEPAETDSWLSLVEISGYLVRAYEHSETPNWTISPYAAQSLLLLLAPNLFAASVYMTFGRLVRLTKGESLTIIKPQYMTKIFVSGDVISFLIQCGGKCCPIASRLHK